VGVLPYSAWVDVCRVTVRWVYCHTLCGWMYVGLQLGGCTAILCVWVDVCRVTVRWVYCHTLRGWMCVGYS